MILKEKLKSGIEINVRKKLEGFKLKDIPEREKEPEIPLIDKDYVKKNIAKDDDDIDYFSYASDIYIRIYNEGLEDNNNNMFDNLEIIKKFKEQTIEEFINIANPDSGYAINENDEGYSWKIKLRQSVEAIIGINTLKRFKKNKDKYDSEEYDKIKKRLSSIVDKNKERIVSLLKELAKEDHIFATYVTLSERIAENCKKQKKIDELNIELNEVLLNINEKNNEFISKRNKEVDEIIEKFSTKNNEDKNIISYEDINEYNKKVETFNSNIKTKVIQQANTINKYLDDYNEEKKYTLQNIEASKELMKKANELFLDKFYNSLKELEKIREKFENENKGAKLDLIKILFERAIESCDEIFSNVKIDNEKNIFTSIMNDNKPLEKFIEFLKGKIDKNKEVTELKLFLQPIVVAFDKIIFEIAGDKIKYENDYEKEGTRVLSVNSELKEKKKYIYKRTAFLNNINNFYASFERLSSVAMKNEENFNVLEEKVKKIEKNTNDIEKSDKILLKKLEINETDHYNVSFLDFNNVNKDENVEYNKKKENELLDIIKNNKGKSFSKFVEDNVEKTAISKGILKRKTYSCCFLKPENGRTKVNIVLSNIDLNSRGSYLNFNFTVKEGDNEFSYQYKLPDNKIKLCCLGNINMEKDNIELPIDEEGHVDFSSVEEEFKNQKKDNPFAIFYKKLKNMDFPKATTIEGGRIKFYEDESCILKGVSKSKLSGNASDGSRLY